MRQVVAAVLLPVEPGALLGQLEPVLAVIILFLQLQPLLT